MPTCIRTLFFALQMPTCIRALFFALQMPTCIRATPTRRKDRISIPNSLQDLTPPDARGKWPIISGADEGQEAVHGNGGPPYPGFQIHNALAG
jgi:hypothetical protein